MLINKKFLLGSLLSSFFALKANGMPVFKWGYSGQEILTKSDALWEALPRTASIQNAELIKRELGLFTKLVVQDLLDRNLHAVSSVHAAPTLFDVQYRLINVLKEVDALFNSQAALECKGSAKRAADFISSYVQLAAQRRESSEPVCKVKYSFLKSVARNVGEGINKDNSSDYKIETFADQINSQVIFGFNKWLERRSRPYDDGFTAVEFHQVDTVPGYLPTPVEPVQDKGSLRELTGFRDCNNLCSVCNKSFEKGVMVAPFACKRKLHLAHPRCISGKMKCPDRNCGAGIGSCSGEFQEDCVICLEPLFGQHKEVTAVFKCAEGVHYGKTHLLHHECARNLLKTKANSTCPQCRADNINMF